MKIQVISLMIQFLGLFSRSVQQIINKFLRNHKLQTFRWKTIYIFRRRLDDVMGNSYNFVFFVLQENHPYISVYMIQEESEKFSDRPRNDSKQKIKINFCSVFGEADFVGIFLARPRIYILCLQKKNGFHVTRKSITSILIFIRRGIRIRNWFSPYSLRPKFVCL